MPSAEGTLSQERLDEDEVTRRVQMRQLGLLLSNARIAVAMNAVAVVIFAIIMAGHVPGELLILWSAIGGLILAMRASLRSFYHAKPGRFSPPVWLHIYTVSVLAMGLFWSAGVWFVAYTGQNIHREILVLLYACLTVGAVSALSVHAIAAVAFFVPTMMGFALYMFFLGGGVNIAMGVIPLLLLLPLCWVAYNTQNLLIRAIRSSVEKAGLVARLAREKNSYQGAFHVTRLVVQNIDQGLILFDKDLHLVTWNRAFIRLMGADKKFLLQHPTIEEFIRHSVTHGEDEGAEDVEAFVCAELAKLREKAGKSWTETNHHRDGTIVERRINPLPDGGLVAIYTDVTEQHKKTRRLKRKASRDSLTGLINRTEFEEALESCKADVQAGEGAFAVLLLDLDHFKTVNDTLGHPAGDALLKQVAGRLRRCSRESDIVARLGGDEFAILVQEAADEQKVAAMARRIIEHIGQPMTLGDETVDIGVSIGIAFCPRDCGHSSDIVSHADKALYRAKENGRNRFERYDEQMGREIAARDILERTIRIGLDSHQFTLFYQPQINLKTMQISGVEALMRWNHPERGWVGPADFLPVAEVSRLIIPLTERLLPEACWQASVWRARGLPPLIMAVNLSPLHFRGTDLVNYVAETLEETGLAAQCLTLEINDSFISQKSEGLSTMLESLADLGVGLTIDGYGTGGSSISWLRQLPVDKLKIDRSILADLQADAPTCDIIESVITLGRGLGLTVLAEGVENQAQLDFLRGVGCDQAQGFFLSRPLPPDELTRWIEEHMARVA